MPASRGRRGRRPPTRRAGALEHGEQRIALPLIEGPDAVVPRHRRGDQLGLPRHLLAGIRPLAPELGRALDVGEQEGHYSARRALLARFVATDRYGRSIRPDRRGTSTERWILALLLSPRAQLREARPGALDVRALEDLEAHGPTVAIPPELHHDGLEHTTAGERAEGVRHRKSAVRCGVEDIQRLRDRVGRFCPIGRRPRRRPEAHRAVRGGSVSCNKVTLSRIKEFRTLVNTCCVPDTHNSDTWLSGRKEER